MDFASPAVRQALANFCVRHDLVLMVLFGSRAKGHATPLSDVDLAVLSHRRDLDVEYRETAWEELLALLGRGDVDLVWLNHAPPLLAYQVATSGQVLFEAGPGVFRDFTLLALKRYWDSAKFAQLEREALRRFLQRRRDAG